MKDEDTESNATDASEDNSIQDANDIWEDIKSELREP